MLVEYRFLDDFPGYRFGFDGSIWSCRLPGRHFGRFGRWKQLNPAKIMKLRRGVMMVTAMMVRIPSRNGYVYRQVHRLILEAFVGPCPEGMEGCHKDNDPTNNTVDNLRWDTRAANYRDRFECGTENNGSKNGRAKLTEANVVEIRRLYASGTTQVALAARFGITQTSVSHICLRKTWSHVA